MRGHNLMFSLRHKKIIFEISSIPPLIWSSGQRALGDGYTTIRFTAIIVTLLLPKMKIAEFAKSVDLDEVAHYEPPHPDLHCLPSSF